MRWRDAWWMLWHPVKALEVCLFLLLWIIAFWPVVTLLLMFDPDPAPRRRVVRGEGFTMRDP